MRTAVEKYLLVVCMYRTALITAYALLLLFLGSGCTIQSPTTHTNPSTPDLASYPWVYLRDRKPLKPGEQVVSIIAVGDLLLGRGVTAEADPLQHTAGWLQTADLAIANLEGVLVAGGQPRTAPAGQPQPIILKGSPDSANLLSQAGFDILNLANNHSLDYGIEGHQESINHLQRAGLAVTGTASADTAVPFIQEIDGLRIAFLAFNAVPDPYPQAACPALDGCEAAPIRWDPQSGSGTIAVARALADAVIVSIHWGFEYESQPDPAQETAAKAMLDAGADLIIGHHPHVPQPIIVQGERLIAYSLGNFLFDQDQSETGQGLALRAFFDKEGLRAAQALPLHAGLQPSPLPIAEAEPWLSTLLPPAERLGYVCSTSNCTPVEAPPTAAESRFYSGQIDLTGDGQPETIRREGEQITIYEQGSAVWQSPEAWRVVDVALGDPNDDGRYEIMLAMWQEDADGHERSQPYIIGYRGGIYDLLWGGRPVADPILELKVGDVDGDGSDELIVIEELADGSAQALSVWRWAGWTFTHIWRSEYGTYSDLLLVDGQNPLISVVSDCH